MILQLNISSHTPIYVQLRNQIVMGIGSGQLKAGEGLPNLRQLAGMKSRLVGTSFDHRELSMAI